MNRIIPWEGAIRQHQLALQDSGMALKTGTIVDATIIAAPSSTKNEDKQRDPNANDRKSIMQKYKQ